MIIVQLRGGMGNQMFQYALARTLSQKHQCDLAVDISLCFKKESLDSTGLSLRRFDLEMFNIKGKVIDKEPSLRVFKLQKQDRIKRAAVLAGHSVLSQFSDTFYIRIHERKSVYFDKTLLNLPKNTILHGYFPSFKYFKDSSQIIRNDFTFKLDVSEQNKELVEIVTSTNSVSLHIRRGDYVSNEKTRQKFGLCSLDYYNRAVEHISKMVDNPQYFIFTDDQEFVLENLKMDFPMYFVSHNTGEKTFEDLRLMQCCRHNIIANSSFSWWGAWLNQNPEKIVICPVPSFDKINIRDDDFYPESWIKLPKQTQ